MMLSAISAEPIKMPNGINHHLLKPTLLYPPRRSERGATPPGSRAMQ
jgi:hypothetical protein